MSEADTEVQDLDGEAEQNVEDDEQTEAEAGEETTAEAEGESTEAESEGDAADEVIVTIGDEAPPQDEDDFDGKPAPEWARNLRKQYRELARENRELKAQQTAAKPAEKADEVGERPKLADYDFDEDKLAEAVEQWTLRKQAAAAKEAKKREAEEEQHKAWQAKLEAYGKAKAALKVRDFEDAEVAAQTNLSTTQQGVILQGSEDSALLVYALGKNPKKLAELSKIADPVKFAFAVAKLETQLKVQPKKTAPLPERSVTGAGGRVVNSTAHLDRLQQEARRSGDYTKYFAAKNGSGKKS